MKYIYFWPSSCFSWWNLEALWRCTLSPKEELKLNVSPAYVRKFSYIRRNMTYFIYTSNVFAFVCTKEIILSMQISSKTIRRSKNCDKYVKNCIKNWRYLKTKGILAFYYEGRHWNSIYNKGYHLISKNQRFSTAKIFLLLIHDNIPKRLLKYKMVFIKIL